MPQKQATKIKKFKDIGIAYDAPVPLSIAVLNDFQGELKELSEASYAKLSKEIMKTGFAFAPHAWQNPKDKKWYLVDGHQRIKTVRRLMHESGFRVPKIPVIPVKAKTYAEAKRRVLQAASHYGEVTPQGMIDFMKDANIDLGEFTSSFEFPTIDIGSFFDTKEEKEPKKGSEEVEGGEFTKLVHTCPKCGHKFARD